MPKKPERLDGKARTKEKKLTRKVQQKEMVLKKPAAAGRPPHTQKGTPPRSPPTSAQEGAAAHSTQQPSRLRAIRRQAAPALFLWREVAVQEATQEEATLIAQPAPEDVKEEKGKVAEKSAERIEIQAPVPL